MILSIWINRTHLMLWIFSFYQKPWRLGGQSSTSTILSCLFLEFFISYLDLLWTSLSYTERCDNLGIRTGQKGLIPHYFKLLFNLFKVKLNKNIELNWTNWTEHSFLFSRRLWERLPFCVRLPLKRNTNSTFNK